MLPQPVQSMLPRGFNQCSPSIQCFSSTHSESPRPQRSPVDRPLPHPPPQWPSSTAFRSSQSMLPLPPNQCSPTSPINAPSRLYVRFSLPKTTRGPSFGRPWPRRPSSIELDGVQSMLPSPPINAPPPRPSNAPKRTRPIQCFSSGLGGLPGPKDHPRTILGRILASSPIIDRVSAVQSMLPIGPINAPFTRSWRIVDVRDLVPISVAII
jgi:hypothetical protein